MRLERCVPGLGTFGSEVILDTVSRSPTRSKYTCLVLWSWISAKQVSLGVSRVEKFWSPICGEEGMISLGDH